MVEIVTREDVKKGLNDGSLILIDVREADEYAAGHIPGALNMPLSSFDPAAIPQSPGKRVAFSCRSGQRTLRALDMAHRAGRLDVKAHYAGSMNDWIQAGEEIAVG